MSLESSVVEVVESLDMPPMADQIVGLRYKVCSKCDQFKYGTCPLTGAGDCTLDLYFPQVVEAIKDQVDRFIHISSDFYHPVWVEFSERLAQTAPFKEPARIFLGNSGTEAVEAAIKFARLATAARAYGERHAGSDDARVANLGLLEVALARRQM